MQPGLRKPIKDSVRSEFLQRTTITSRTRERRRGAEDGFDGNILSCCAMLSRRLRRYYGHPRRVPVEYISSFSYASAARILRPRQINREASEITTRTYVKGKYPRLATRRSEVFSTRIRGAETTDGYLYCSHNGRTKKLYHSPLTYLPNTDIL